MNTEKERLLILEMLKNGTITEDEALRLLDALKDHNEDPTWEDNLKKVMRNLIESSKSVGRKFDEWISEGIDIDFRDKDFGPEAHEIILTENTLGIDDLAIELKDKNASVQLQTWTNDSVEIKAQIRYKTDKKSKEPISLKKYGRRLVVSPSGKLDQDSYSAKYTVCVPTRKLDMVDINIVNGHITIKDLNSKLTKLTSTNGKILTKNLVSDTLEIKSTNGSTDVEATTSTNSTIHNTNGSISVKNSNIESADIKTVNGKIDIDGYDGVNLSLDTTYGNTTIKGLSSSVQRLDSRSTNGHIYLFITEDNTPIKAITTSQKSNSELENSMTSPLLTNFISDEGSTSAYSDNYSEQTEHLLANLNTISGNIRIG